MAFDKDFEDKKNLNAVGTSDTSQNNHQQNYKPTKALERLLGWI